MATGSCSLCRGMKSLRYSASCGCQYCTIQCARDYILRAYANEQVICNACSRPFTAAFLCTHFGNLTNLREEVRARNQPVQRHIPQAPAPPRVLHCDICKQQYAESLHWTLPCGHTYCRPCIVAKIQRGAERNDFASICCPVDNAVIDEEQVRALTYGNKDLWMAYMNLVPLTAITSPGESIYQCPNHSFFRVSYEAGVASVKCPQCPTDICLACKRPFAAGHTC